MVKKATPSADTVGAGEGGGTSLESGDGNVVLGDAAINADGQRSSTLPDGDSDGQSNRLLEATPVDVRVLVECAYGSPNDVVPVSAAAVVAAEKAGFIDSDPEAVAYARQQ